jgi:glycosyltransferase involved in cell wall biosynthesis
MATYNGEAFIREQLKSILLQLGPDDEVIISDDSSKDQTTAIIESLSDSRIRLLKDQKFKSAIFNFENAINHASGDVIFLSDQDDVWLPGKVEKMMALFPEYNLVVSDCIITDANLNEIAPSMFRINRSGRGLIRNTIKNAYLGCTMAFDRKVLKFALPFPVDIPMHDMWLGFVADMFCRVIFIEDKLVYYRRHSSNTVQWEKGKIESVYSFSEKLKFRYIILKRLFERKRSITAGR